MKSDLPFIDLHLARRLERTEGTANANFVDARASVYPESGAKWIEVAGAYAMYDGIESPLTQTFGLGVFDTVSESVMEEIEEFFKVRNSPVFHEVSPLSGNEFMVFLSERGYHPFEATSVMFRSVDQPLESQSESSVRRVLARVLPGDKWGLWANTVARGWGEHEGVSDFMIDYGRVAACAKGVHPFIAEIGGEAVAAGALSINQGTALFAGAATIPEARKQGAQFALLEARLRFAQESGCDLAMMCAQPGSASQRNAERHGFRIAYTRLKWMRR